MMYTNLKYVHQTEWSLLEQSCNLVVTVHVGKDSAIMRFSSNPVLCVFPHIKFQSP